MNHCLLLLTTVVMAISYSGAIAEEDQSELTNNQNQSIHTSETGVEIGALFLIGVDLRIFYRKMGSPWLYGFRYLDIKDDFINESYAGLPNDESDKEYTNRVGFYFNYLFNHSYDKSFYLGGAIYNSMNKIECASESDSDSTLGIYFGGGYRGRLGKSLGYKLGMLLSPFVSHDLNTSICSSESDMDIDVNASLVFTF